MVQQVMQRHSGTMSILPGPEENKGTIIRLSFPADDGVASQKPRAAIVDSSSVKLKVLVVDDEPMLRMVVEEMLTAEGHAVSVTNGGPEASEIVADSIKSDEPFDVVISDIEMPVLNGRMLSDFIETESAETEVILMTGWADSQLDIETISTRVVGLLKNRLGLPTSRP